MLKLPDNLCSWPWPRSINPHYEECKAASSAWCESFHAFSPKAQKAFNLCDFNLLASMAFARLNKDGCRIGCDLMNLFFIFDEWSDVSDDKETRKQANIIMDALRNPSKPRPVGEWIGGEAARQYWQDATRTATAGAQRRFVDAFQLYTDSVVQQSADRTNDYIRDIESYFHVRRDTIGAKPSFAINEVHMNLPDYVLDDPIIKSLTAACIDMLIIGNDVCSYNVEQARGDDGHNLVTIVMKQLHLNTQGALDWIGKLHDELAGKFLADLPKVPSWGEVIDLEVAVYVDDLGNWVRANDQWSFESERYFGKDGLRVLRERTITLLPKSTLPATLPTDIKMIHSTMEWLFLWLAWFVKIGS